MKLTKSVQIKHSLLIDSTILTRIFSFLRENYATIAVRAYSADGSILETQNLSDLTEFDNLFKQRFIEIRLSGRSGPDASMELTLGKRGDAWPYVSFFGHSACTAEVDLICPRREDLTVKEQALRDLFTLAKPWYSLLSRINFHWAFTALWLGSVTLFLLRKFSGSATSGLSVCSDTYDCFMFIVSTNVLYVFTLLILTSSVLNLFPPILFLIGKQMETHAHIKNARRVIFGSVILASVVGYIVNKLSN